MIGKCEATGRWCEVEGAHVKAGGVHGANGCRCPANIITITKRLHRFYIHGTNGGWSAVLHNYPHLKKRYDEAIRHWELRQRGEGCGARTKAGRLARARIARASGECFT